MQLKYVSKYILDVYFFIIPRKMSFKLESPTDNMFLARVLNDLLMSRCYKTYTNL